MASDAEKKKLENHIHQLLLANGGVILLNSFWSSFQSTYHKLPDPATFGQHKRNELLSLFPSVCEVDCAPVSVGQRKVRAKGNTGKNKAPAPRNTTVSATQAARVPPQAAVGEAAAQQPKQVVKVKVKQSKEKVTKHTGDVSKSKRAQKENLAKRNSIALRAEESVNASQLTGDPDKSVDSRRKLSASEVGEEKSNLKVKVSAKPRVGAEKLPLSKKDQKSEDSNKPVQGDKQTDTISLTEPGKMASLRQGNTHIRFGEDMEEAQMQRAQQMMPQHHHQANFYQGLPVQINQYQSTGYNRNFPHLPYAGMPRGGRHQQPHRQPVPLQQAVYRVPENQMKNVVEDSIDRLVESKQYVSLERIEKLITQHFHVASLAELGIRSFDDIPSLREHQRLLCKVNAYIQAFVKVRSVATVFELSECLKEYAHDGRDFDELRIGPLVTQPLVYEFFKMPADADIPSVVTDDIFEHLRGYLGANNLWTDRSVQLEDFMEYLTEKYDVDTPFKLGIRIRSMPLLIGILKKAQRECGKTMGAIPAHIRDMIENDLATAAKRFLATLVHKEPGVCVVRQQCLEMAAPQLFVHVMMKFTVMIEFVGRLQAMHPSAALNKVVRICQNIHQLLNALSRDELMMRLFQFVVCCSNEAMHAQLQEILALEYERLTPSQPTNGTNTKELPSLDKVVVLIRKYLERCLMHGALSLTNLARVEEKLLEDFGLPHFSDLGRGGFLQFLLDNSNIKQFLDECGGMTLGGSSVGTAAESAFHPSISMLFEFMRQCGMATDRAQHCALEGALCSHYRVKEVKSLGHGSVAHLVTSLEKQTKHNQESIVFYEGALCANNRKTVFNTTDHQVGLLGHVTKEKALACLQNCPLLENMCEWSHWEVVFKPELGELKDFLHKYGGVRTIHVGTDGGAKVQMMTNILALETSPGSLLRISSSSTAEAFATTAAAADVVATCGHLVSLVAANRGISNMPQALLANHMMTALLKIQGRHSQQAAITRGDDSGSCEVVRFVLDCLMKMPLIICEAVANQVLLEPLSKVVGSAKSKSLLLRLADSGEAQTRLQLLGWLLGVADWTNSFHGRCNPPPGGMTATQDNTFDDIVEVLDLSDESEDDDEGDTILVLSDADDDVIEIPDGATSSSDILKSEPSDDRGDENAIKQLLSDIDDDKAMLDIDTDAVNKKEVKLDIKEIVCVDDDPCRTLVEQIRRDEFGIGVALGEDGERLMLKQQQRLGRSLDRLSRDLYSKDTHFVLELIQNADDNSYPVEMVGEMATTVPAVKFVVESDCITVFNNESGFEGENIRAVCDVGRSTKGKHKYGYIGQKGIGFKSVFRVTDRPEIHSNGFHICFDVKNSPMGYILPHWIGGEDDSGKTREDDSWKTRIELPLKEDMRNQTQCRSLAARFHDVHPSLLLFLHRLKHLTVQNEVEGVTMNIERRDLGNGVVEIRHDNVVDRWLVVKHRLDASAISLQAKSGVEVESTEVALAFPLHNLEKDAAQVAYRTPPAKQRVFAYLPLRSYGFRFVIQGDFDVPSSREDVDRDSMWNQWLRNEMHSLFVDALHHFKNHPEFSEIEAVRYFIQFIPLEDEILEFFKPVASAILQQLRHEPCLPTEVSTDTGIQWKLPSQLVLTKDPLVRDVITSKLLQDHLGLDFLHKDVATMLNPSMMQCLGIQILTTSHLIEIGKVIVSWLTDSNAAVRQAATVNVAKWLACVYRSLDEFDHNEELMAKLKDIVMVPLMSGEVVSLATKTVFFPIDSAEQMRLQTTKTEGPLAALMCDLSMLHPAFIGALDNISNSQVSRLLEQLGVKHLQPRDIIQHHIMPTLSGDAWKNRPHSLLVSYLVYLKQQWDQNKLMVNMNELRPVAVVMTNHGPRRSAEEPVHFTQQYGNKIDLPRTLPGYDWLMLHECYAKSGGSRWREFFLELGVLDFLSVKEKVITVAPTELESTPWAAYKTMLPMADEYKISDYECIEFDALVRSCSGATTSKSREAMYHQMQTLFELLDHDWDVKYSKFTITQITDSHDHILRRDIDTSFALLLKSLPWLPSCVMRVSTDNGKFTVTQCREMMVGQDLFVRVPEISHLLGDHVPYLEARPGPKSTFPQFLGIQNSIKVEFVVGLLKGWCERTTVGAPRQFNTSMQHIKAIYRYLFDNMPPKQLQDLVHDCPLIFIASTVPRDGMTKLDGVFLNCNELRWDDPSCLFTKYRESLAGTDSADAYRLIIKPFYSDMEVFFLQHARVKPAPELSDYAQLLVHIAMTVPLPQALPDVLRIFTIVGDMFAREPDHVKVYTAMLRKVLQNSSPIPVKGGRWVPLSSCPMIADDKSMERLFQGKDGVNFVDLGERLGAGRKYTADGIDKDLVLACLKELGVYQLSDCLQEDYVTEMYTPCPELQQYVHDVLPMIQALLCNEFQAIYAELTAGHIADRIKAMRFVKVGRLELVYRLKHNPEMVTVLNEKCRLVRDQELCVHRDHVTSFKEVNKELARYFSGGDMTCRNEIRDLLLDLQPLVVNASPELQQFVEDKLDELPSTEEAWQVDEPVFHRPPPQTRAPQQFEETMNIDEGQGQQGYGNHDNNGGLKAWPPRSSGNPDMRQRGSSSGAGGRQMWPPPAPPQGVDYTALPSSLRPSKLPPVSQDGTKSDHTNDGSHVSRPRGEGAPHTEGATHHGAARSGHAAHPQGSERKPPVQGDHAQRPDDASHETSSAPGGSEQHDNETPADVTTQADAQNLTVAGDPSAATSQDAKQVVPMVSTGDADGDVDGSDGIATPPKKRRRSESLDVFHQRERFIDSAVWLQDSETPYEHVDIGTLVIPDGMTLAEGEHNAAVGRWGEQLVYSYLTQTARDVNSRIISVSWINEDQETGDPYDFVIKMKNCDDPSKVSTVFVEVKSTVSDSKNFFEMSLPQIDFARQKNDAFHLYRVFNAGHRAAVRLMRLENLAMKLERKEVRLCMFV